MLVRVIDIGSNSVKASLYAFEDGARRLVSREKLDYSLGNAVFSKGSIPEADIARIATFLAGNGGAHASERPLFTFALATSAVRSAQNKTAFVERLSRDTGVDVRVLSGAEESFLIHHGILSSAAPRPGEVVKTIDIGGGSAEVSWSRDGKYLFGHSYELGAIRLARRFFDDKPYTGAALESVREHALDSFRAGSPAEAPPADRAIGSSGNVRAIGRMLRKVRATTFARQVPGVTPGALEDIAELAIGRSPAEIAGLFDLQPERAKIIMPAVMVLLASLRHFGIRRLELAEAGLREGAAAFWSRHGHLNLPVPETHDTETGKGVDEDA
jgi:exopolyphosphatase / guanosine-5'-triphosphate,3'-diphosphate pyrophosphatase